MMKSIVHIEIRLTNECRLDKEKINDLANEYLSRRSSFKSGIDEELILNLSSYGVDYVNISITSPSNETTNMKEIPYFCCLLKVHIYRLYSTLPQDELSYSNNEEELDVTKLFSHQLLPCKEFEGVWESLIVDNQIKESLLAYSNTGLLFKNVDQTLVCCNRVILLHGPPGTGKTSLLHGLCQKIAIRQFSSYSKGIHCLEVNAHSLFSKWFSESGKLVMKMFEMIRQLACNENSLVFVVIDEVESLTASRGRNSSSDPSDAVRVVNAMLTQIDRLRNLPNVLVLATSNVTEQIDAAFLDRADLKLYLGPPNLNARREILNSSLNALKKAKICVEEEPIMMIKTTTEMVEEEKQSLSNTNEWIEKCAIVSDGLSGRSLRKLPVQAFSFYVREQTCISSNVMAKAMYDYILYQTKNE